VQTGHICHHTTNDGRTSYEANSRNAYQLLRSGRFIEVVEKDHGKAAAAVVTQLLLLGHASVGQLKESSRSYYESDKNQDNTADTNSLTGSAKDRFEVELDNALRMLCKHRLVCRLRQAYFRTEADTRQLAEEKVMKSHASASKGTKLKEEIAGKVEQAIEREVDSYINIPKSNSGTAMQKRKIDDSDDVPTSKRLRLTNGIAAPQSGIDSTSFSDDTNSFNDSLVVRLNHARIAILFRNMRLLDLVTDTYGGIVSRTYEAVLKQLEPDLPDSIEDTSLGPELEQSHGTSSEVDERLLAQDLAHHETSDERQGSRWPSVNGYVNGATHRLKPEALSHLEILCGEPYKFLSHSLEYPDRYVVDFSDLSIHLRNAELFRIISSRFDKYAVRIIRVFLNRGKLDEKHLQEIVLMSAKELRHTLATLQQAGFLELQEVPREAQRQPSRTMYLWFYDPDRVRKMLIEDTYKCMTRCLQRMKVERDKVKPTIEKSERTDVRGKEEKLLAKAELAVLKEWRKKEEWLLGEVGRLDELIFVLRDS
jgi:DNA-directed RNA polymerase III subunit RPC3